MKSNTLTISSGYKLALVIALLSILFSCADITWETKYTGIVEDVILITGNVSNSDKEVTRVGDIDLTEGQLVIETALDPDTSTHWWLLGHKDGQVVFSSSQNLERIELYDIAPYEGCQLAWNIPLMIENYYNESGFVSPDWIGATMSNHSVHTAESGDYATLWMFGREDNADLWGRSLGRFKVQLHFNNQ